MFEEEIKKYVTIGRLESFDVKKCVLLYQKVLKTALDKQCSVLSKVVRCRSNQSGLTRLLEI